ncbi:MAG: ZIP family metal transporter [Lachnospiraceae bacterium]|nr:ZIP family metal transporter [Lachnospiraceae bacterium]
MYIDVIKGLMIPLLGTTLGSGCVLFMKKELNITVQRIMLGFASGVMIAASVWSLLIPAMEQSENMGSFAFVPAVVGFSLGILFLLFLDNVIPHMHMDETVEGPKAQLKKTTMMVLAVVLHNIPEGMAVGVVFAGMLSGQSGISSAAAMTLALGIAIQNFPEGAIISMPLKANGLGKGKSMFYGFLSGVVEPVAGLVTVILTGIIVPVLPYLLSFAAGAMIYVVIEELIPEMSEGEHSNKATLAFMVGFCLMMALDVALG